MCCGRENDGVRFALARLKSDTHEFLVRAGVIERIRADAVFLQVSDGTTAFRAGMETAPARPTDRSGQG
jgi:hypothetical protein